MCKPTSCQIICSLFKNTFPVAQTLQRRMRDESELERMWKEAIVA